MFNCQKEFKIVYVFLFIVLVLIFINKNISIMAMDNNKGKEFLNEIEPSDEEVDEFFQLLKKAHENIKIIKKRYPCFKHSSYEKISKDISQWTISNINKQKRNFNNDQEQLSNNKKQKTFDLNKLPEDE